MRKRQVLRQLRLVGAVLLCLLVVVVLAWGFKAGNATVATGATALVVFVFGEYRRWRLAAQQDRWGRIAEEYESFFAVIRRQVGSADSRTPEEIGREQEQAMARFADKLMLWGSERVVKAWVGMRRDAAEGEPPLTVQMENFGRMVLAMRREFGHSDWRLEERDLFRIIFTDEIEVLLAKAELSTARTCWRS